MPLAVVTSVGLFIVGLAFMFFCASRYRRRFEHPWIELSVTAALILLVSAAALVTSLVRHLQ